MLTFATFYDLNDKDTLVKLRTCTAGDTETTINALAEGANANSRTMSGASSDNAEAYKGRIARRYDAADPESPPPVCREAVPANATAESITWNQSHGRRSAGEAGSYDDIITSLRSTQTFLKDALNCEESIIYGYTRGTVVGVYAGPEIQNRGIASGLVQETIDSLAAAASKGNGAPTRQVTQVCGGGRNSNHAVGIVIDPFGDLAWAQKALRSWSEAKCVSEPASPGAANVASRGVEIPTIVKKVESRSGRLSSRAVCHSLQAAYGDTLESLASSCQVSVRDFIRYNDLRVDSDWTPTPYQWLCCSSGPKVAARDQGPRPDGTCATYIIQNQDTCSGIAAKEGIRQGDIYAFNQDTYGWGGCNSLFPGMRICISSGTPRLPAPNKDAVCGPTMPGTQSPTGDEKVEDLNPCPIKACCNIWGNCGVDIDFCIPTESETGNPGTAAPNTNGCVQNCGLDLVTGSAPDEFIKVGYFEAFNVDRECLRMSPKNIPSSYTHVHYAFANITTAWEVSLGDYADVFKEFKALKGPKRVVAFGGWAFSTAASTYQYFREGTKSANRAAFASAVVDFVVSEGLDGVDFDWEYPGEPDIPGIPAGDEEETENYLEFVKLVKSKMPSGKTVSIAAPASYWYLKQFLIAEMSEHLDYIIYMAYDLHGTWDSGSQWSQSGCKAGNCLRSHVNMTETMSSLVMVTKAGVPSNKIVVGVSSYGRSFRMADPSCTGPMCTYTGAATPGRCTQTGGYISNAEINELIATGEISKRWTDDTESNYVVYGKADWVAYMDDDTKQSRIAKYKSLNFKGSSDWAIDLQKDFGGPGGGGGDGGDGGDGDDGSGETTDGTCGAQNMDTFCGSWPAGTCCSSGGLCGSTDAFCGSGCQSGCPSKDGTCGWQSNYNTCPAGSCCSKDGKCGKGDGFCGNGCQSGECNGGDGSVVYIDTTIWQSPSQTLQCYPPCTVVLPPLTLPSVTTISVPPVTETLDEVWPVSSSGSTTVFTTKTIIVTITIPAITTSVIEFSNVEWSTTTGQDNNSTVIWAWTSILPPLVTLTNSFNSMNWTWIYNYGPFPSPTATTSDPNPPPTAIRTTFPVSKGRPRPTCRRPGSCGDLCERNCGPPGIRHGGGGGGGGGIHFCIGPWCPPGWGGPPGGGGGRPPCLGTSCPGNCVGPGCGGGGGSDGNPDDGDPDDCPTPSTVSDCQVICTTSPTPKPCTTECFDVVGCDITGTTTTTNRATGTPPPGFEVDVADIWELPDYNAIDADWPALSSSIQSEYKADHSSKSAGMTETPTQSPGDGSTTTGGSGTETPTETPTEPPTSMPPPYTGKECKSYTTYRQCNGEGAHSACTTATLCVPSPACPSTFTASGTPICDDPEQLCIRTTIETRCAITGRAVTATATGPAAVEATPTTTPAPELKTRPRSKPLLPVPDTKAEREAKLASNSDSGLDSVLPWDRNATSLDQLVPRQNGCGGSANGGCDYIRFCAACAKIIEVPCIKAFIDAITGPLSGTEVRLTINEDDKVVCNVGLACDIWEDDCSGLVDAECGDEYTVSFKYNYVVYYSPKYDQTFPLYLERDETDVFIFCWQPFGLIDVPSGCLEDTFYLETGPCGSTKREAPTLLSIDGFGDDSFGSWATTPEDELAASLNSSLKYNVLNSRAFSDFGTDPNGCTPQQRTKLTAWVEDVVAMTQAAIVMIEHLQAATFPYDPQVDAIGSTMNNLLGIDFATATAADYDSLKGLYTTVRDFANGVFPHRQAWIFCGDHFTVPQQWTDWVRNQNNQLIPAPPDAAGVQNGYLRLDQVGPYQRWLNGGLQPYWIPAIKNYVFYHPGGYDPGQPGQKAGAMCSRNNKNQVAVTMLATLQFPIITICSPMNKDGLDGFTVFPNDILAEFNIPLAKQARLDKLRTGSGTLLHEFIHAVRPVGTTPDMAGNSGGCFRESKANPSNARNSPECATLFAIAMYFQLKTAGTADAVQFIYFRALPIGGTPGNPNPPAGNPP